MAQGPSGTEPQFSPDGHWYWTGNEWIPASQAPRSSGASSVPTSVAYSPLASGSGVAIAQAPRKSHTGRNVAIGCGGLIALLIVVGVIGSALSSGATNSSPAAAISSPSADNASSRPASPAPTPHPSPSPSPHNSPSPQAPAVLLDMGGSGIKNSAQFNAPDHWRLAYTYDCTSFLGGQGNFQVYLYQGSDLVDILVNELGAKGSDTTDVYSGGDGMHLEMNSECNWHVTVYPA